MVGISSDDSNCIQYGYVRFVALVMARETEEGEAMIRTMTLVIIVSFAMATQKR